MYIQKGSVTIEVKTEKSDIPISELKDKIKARLMCVDEIDSNISVEMIKDGFEVSFSVCNTHIKDDYNENGSWLEGLADKDDIQTTVEDIFKEVGLMVIDSEFTDYTVESEKEILDRMMCEEEMEKL